MIASGIFEANHEIKDMTGVAKKALDQIKSKRYTQGLEGYACTKSYGYGIAFCRKACVVTVSDLLQED